MALRKFRPRASCTKIDRAQDNRSCRATQLQPKRNHRNAVKIRESTIEKMTDGAKARSTGRLKQPTGQGEPDKRTPSLIPARRDPQCRCRAPDNGRRPEVMKKLNQGVEQVLRMHNPINSSLDAHLDAFIDPDGRMALVYHLDAHVVRTRRKVAQRVAAF